jgi:hypothetical protein
LRRGSEVDEWRQTKRALKNEQPRCAGAPDSPRGARRLDKGADRVPARGPLAAAETESPATAFFLERRSPIGLVEKKFGGPGEQHLFFWKNLWPKIRGNTAPNASLLVTR